VAALAQPAPVIEVSATVTPATVTPATAPVVAARRTVCRDSRPGSHCAPGCRSARCPAYAPIRSAYHRR
jgi:hypothetical protein